MLIHQNLANLKPDIDNKLHKYEKWKKDGKCINYLSNLKNKVDESYVYKLIPVPVDLSKLSDVVKNNVVKNMYIILRLKMLRAK